MRILIVEPDGALREAIALDAESWDLVDDPADDPTRDDWDDEPEGVANDGDGGNEVGEGVGGSVADAVGSGRDAFAAAEPGQGIGSVASAASVEEGIALLAGDPELLLVDVGDGGEGLDLLRMAGERRLAPARLAMSARASAEEAFELGRLGVRGYLAKPFTLGELRELVDRALHTPPPIDGAASAQVPHVPILAVQDQVKRAMLEQALAQCDGNYVQTARRLGVTRQAVQQMVRRYELGR